MRVEPKLKNAENSRFGTWMVRTQVDSAPGPQADVTAHQSGLWSSGLPHRAQKRTSPGDERGVPGGVPVHGGAVPPG